MHPALLQILFHISDRSLAEIYHTTVTCLALPSIHGMNSRKTHRDPPPQIYSLLSDMMHDDKGL